MLYEIASKTVHKEKESDLNRKKKRDNKWSKATRKHE